MNSTILAKFEQALAERPPSPRNGRATYKALYPLVFKGLQEGWTLSEIADWLEANGQPIANRRNFSSQMSRAYYRYVAAKANPEKASKRASWRNLP